MCSKYIISLFISYFNIIIPVSSQVILYVKGADSTVLNALAPVRAGSPEAAMVERTRALLTEYSRAGLRTLVMAKRTMQPALWEEWLAGHTRAAEIGEGKMTS